MKLFRSIILVLGGFALLVVAPGLLPRAAAAPADLDATFGSGGKVDTNITSGDNVAESVVVQSDGKIVVAGYTGLSPNFEFALVRYNASGSLDTSFNGTGKVITSFGNSNDYGRSVALQSNGKILVVGSGNNNTFLLARYNADGGLDTSFNGAGKVTTAIGSNSTYGQSVAVQNDGRIVVAGYAVNNGSNAGDIALARYNTNGSLDTSFNGTGKVTTAIGTSDDRGFSVALQADGKIVVVGDSFIGSKSSFAVVRYNSDGSLDTSFNGTGKVTTAIGTSDDQATSVALQNDGKIVAAGASNVGATTRFALVRYNANGALDSSFGSGGKVTTSFTGNTDVALSVAVQSDAKIVVAGHAGSFGSPDFALARYNDDGSLDVSFGTGGKATTDIASGDDAGHSMAVQSNGKIVVAGKVFDGSNYSFAVVRYEGGPDTATVSPLLIAPSTGSANKNPSSVVFSLPEAAQAATVTLTFDDGITPRVLALAGSEESQGRHNFSFNPTNPTASVQISSGAAIPDGTYTVTLSYQDALGNPAASASASNVLIDTTPPILTLPANISTEATSASGAVVNFSVNASDMASGAVMPSANPPSGGTFSLGMTTVNVSATDGAGNTQTGSFTVTVRDTTAPVVTPPANVTAEATSANGAVVSYAVATASDAVGVTSLTYSKGNGTTFAIGTTTVTATAKDAANNTGTGAFTLTVRDTTGPVITVPANFTAEATSANGAAVSFSVSASDAVDGVSPVTAAPVSGSTFLLGTTTVNVSATDGFGNTKTGSFTVTVRDTTKPTLNLPANVIAEATGPSGAVVNSSVSASDAVSGPLVPTVSPVSGSTFSIGTTTVNASATDNAGNMQTGTFTVMVSDTTAPTASVPTTLTVPAGPTGEAALGDLSANVTRSDAVGVVSVVQSPTASTVKPLGAHPVTFTMKDAANNQKTVQTTVIVGFAPVTEPIVTPSAKAGPVVKGAATGAPAPGAGTGGLPAGTTLGAFFTPAIGDFRDLAARVTLLAGTKRVGAIYVEDGAGVGSLTAFQGKQADGLATGVTFKSFLDPVLAPGGAIAFGAKVNGLKPTEDEALWTDALGGGLQPILREGHDVPGLLTGTTLKSVTSISLRDGELVVLLKLNPAKGLVTTKNDQVLLRITPSGTNVLLRTGDATNGPRALAITAFVPGQFSKGQGRTHADAGVVVRVKTDTDGDQFVLIDDDGTKQVRLSTSAQNPLLGAQATKMFIPATAGSGTAARITAKFAGRPKLVDSVIFNSSNQFFDHMQSAGDPIPGGGATFASFADPVMNDTPRAVFLAKIAGTNFTTANNTALYDWDATYAVSEIVSTGRAAADGNAVALADTAWKSFTNYALPDGPGVGVIFSAEVTGKAVTAKNKLGLWAEDSEGLVRMLLRGDQDVTLSPGVTKKLANFTLLDALPGSFGSRRSYNSSGSVAVLATFTDKTQALLRVDVP